MIDSEQYDRMVKWKQEVSQFVASLAQYFDKDDIDKATELVDHNEAAIGLSMLAYIAVDNNIQLPEDAKQKIKEWCEDLEELPENF